MKYAITTLLLFSSIIYAEIDFRREAIDWGIVGIAGLGTYTFHNTGPFFEEPLIERRTNLPSLSENLPSFEFYLVASSIGGSVFLLPVSEHTNSFKYNHIKGFSQSIATSAMLTALSKDIFGVPRPDADYRIIAGYDERRYRDSFPSGHSSFAFSCATYSSLYLLKALPSGDWRWNCVRITGTIGLMAGAGAVAYSRVHRNKHYTEDAIAGALLGSGVAIGIFFWRERINNHENSPQFIVDPQGLSLLWTF